jgi:FKBP-type peptidyl-prolyl cis-trans isomerase
MNRRSSRLAPSLCFAMEALENRIVLSSIKPVATVTSLAVQSGTLGQPTTFNVTVNAPASAGSPQGTVVLLQKGQSIGTIDLTATTSAKPRTDASNGTFTVTPQPGGSAAYFGKNAVTAEFVPASSTFARSNSTKSYTVSQPHYTPLANGVKIADITTGTGPAVSDGETASVLYTGYLTKNGKIFDDSVNDGGSPFSFVVGAGQVIPGFDAGIVGMKVGGSRIVEIPPSQGYGAEINGMIPANSTLIFVMTLEAITPASTTTTTTTTA